MWNICRSHCSTPRLFRAEQTHHLNSRPFASSWFSGSSPTRAQSSEILDSSDLFCIDKPNTPLDRSTLSNSQSPELSVVNQQPGHLKDALNGSLQVTSIYTPLSASMINLQNSEESKKMSSTQELSSSQNQESEYKRSFIWSRPSSRDRVDHIMTSSQDSNLHRAPVQAGHGSSVLFQMERSFDAKSMPVQERVSEYHSQFKPFSDYVYVADEQRFRAQTPATKLTAAAAEGNNSEIIPAPKAWFAEVEERCQEANKYRARSQNGSTPIDSEWNGTRSKDTDFLAIAIATQMTIAEKRAERAARSSSAKPANRAARKELNSAPASIIDGPSPKPRPVMKAVTARTTPTPSIDRNNNFKPEVAKKAAPTNETSAKVWIKPKKKSDDAKTPATDNKNEPKAVPRGPKKLPEKTSTMESPAEVKSVPLHTTQIKSPEELTGVKSPEPEAWKVSIEKGNLQWVNNESPVNFDASKDNGNDGSILKPVAINGSKN